MSIADILVVDDDIAVCRIVHRMLSDQQYEVHAAQSVADALRVIEQKSFHLYEFRVIAAIVAIEHSADKMRDDIFLICLLLNIVQEITIELFLFISCDQMRVFFNPR